eukprot:GHRQ01027771.1.p1 GENE.GHRQ01027771.1~~GHRQ01027771.1.p1  ORF type:complete len:151 (+),score=27.73 GHRQ01027771.1:98-550(+)
MPASFSVTFLLHCSGAAGADNSSHASNVWDASAIIVWRCSYGWLGSMVMRNIIMLMMNSSCINMLIVPCLWCNTVRFAGACKILFQLPLIYFILVKYVVACSLTVVARESVTAVAWDSAGGAAPCSACSSCRMPAARGICLHVMARACSL